MNTTHHADVVITDLSDLDMAPAVSLLENAGLSVTVVQSGDPDEIAEAGSQAIALIVGYASIREELIARLPALRIIATTSAGYDMVDTAAAEKRGIWVCNIPSSATEEVAVHAIAGMLGLLRRLPQATDTVRSGRWSTDPQIDVPRPSTLTLGVLGFGKIGQRVAQLSGPFFARVIAYDPWLPLGSSIGGVELVTLAELAGQSNVLTLHSPLTNENHHVIDAAFFTSMQPSSYLINVARGGLIDETALADALASGRIAGAALDVLEEEPPRLDNPLLQNPAVILSPHSAYRSIQSLTEYATLPAKNILAWRETGTPLTAINKG